MIEIEWVLDDRLLSQVIDVIKSTALPVQTGACRILVTGTEEVLNMPTIGARLLK